ncbi:unnamed protein product [Effrenium voratum]|nr:unnamed protein product [Effrenium voratum]
MAGWVFGTVGALLPYGCLLHDTDFRRFLAPYSELPATFAPRPGAAVCFRASNEPGASETEGSIRAECVSLVERPSSATAPASEEGRADAASAPSATGGPAVPPSPELDWATKIRTCLAQIAEAPQSAASEEARQFLRSLLNHSALGTLRFSLRDFLHENLGLAQILADLERCVSRPARRVPRRCSVEGCPRVAVNSVKDPDLYGAAGPRCCAHGARRCSAALCTRLAETGAGTGFRAARYCQQHRVEETRWCCVPGCVHEARRLRGSDAQGPAGHRCRSHGSCREPGCTRIAWGQGRCHRHGGHTCSVPNCERKPRRPVTKQDEHGPPGLRCDAHSVRPIYLGPRREPKQPAAKEDGGAEENRCAYSSQWTYRGEKRVWRCKKEAAGGRFCTDHAAKRRAHIQKQSAKRQNKPQTLEDMERCAYRRTWRSRPSGELKLWRCKRPLPAGARFCQYHELVRQEDYRKDRERRMNRRMTPQKQQPSA